jgi:hypothetical protein
MAEFLMLGILYADPGSGTLIWQFLAAAGFGLLFYTKVIIRKIRSHIGTRERDAEKD